jgi:hypothetical protein
MTYFAGDETGRDWIELRMSSPTLAVVVPWRCDPRLQDLCHSAGHFVASGRIELVLALDGPREQCDVAILERCLDLLPAYPETRVVEAVPGQGPGTARNRGFEATCAPYVTFCDSDDEPNFEELLRAAEHMRRTGNQVLVGAYEIATESEVLRRHVPSARASFVAELTDLAGVWRFVFECAYLRAGRYEFPALRYGEDISFLIQVAEGGPQFCSWPSLLYSYRDSSSFGRLTGRRPSVREIHRLRAILWQLVRSDAPGIRQLAGYWLLRIAFRQKAWAMLADPQVPSGLGRTWGICLLMAGSVRAHLRRRSMLCRDRQ